MPISLLVLIVEKGRLISGFSMFSLACLPFLPFVPSIISEKLEPLRKRKRNSPHKRGPQLLMDMLPARKPAHHQFFRYP